jgi:hypothetical protein
VYIFKSKIYSNDLGSGWNDNHKTAYALAQYTEKIWRAESENFKDDIEIGFNISKKDYGYDIEMSINTNDLDVIDEITGSLSDESRLWDMFLNETRTESLFSDLSSKK